MQGPLEYNGDKDYALKAGEDRCWVEVGGIVVCISRVSDHVVVKTYATSHEEAGPISVTMASFVEAAEIAHKSEAQHG